MVFYCWFMLVCSFRSLWTGCCFIRGYRTCNRLANIIRSFSNY